MDLIKRLFNEPLRLALVIIVSITLVLIAREAMLFGSKQDSQTLMFKAGSMFHDATTTVTTLTKGDKVVQLYGMAHQAENQYYAQVNDMVARDRVNGFVVLRELAGYTDLYNCTKRQPALDIPFDLAYSVQSDHGLIGGCSPSTDYNADFAGIELANEIMQELVWIGFKRSEAQDIYGLAFSSDAHGVLFDPESSSRESTNTTDLLIKKNLITFEQVAPNLQNEVRKDLISKLYESAVISNDADTIRKLKAAIISDRVMIKQRNDILLSNIIRETNAGRSVSVMYGQYHMPHTIEQLKDLGWSVTHTEELVYSHSSATAMLFDLGIYDARLQKTIIF